MLNFSTVSTLIDTTNGVSHDLNRVYTFDHVFGPSQTQQSLFEKCVEPMLTEFLDGYPVTIFAYGQTGSGKTFTMGSQGKRTGVEEDGIIPRTLVKLYEMIKNDSRKRLCISFLEIYCEKVYDLLGKRHEDISIRESAGGLLCVSGLHVAHVEIVDDAMRLLNLGVRKRATGKTDVNEYSSRSHAIFTIYLETLQDDGVTYSRDGRFNLVDLAGSERLKNTKLDIKSERFNESVKINSGLLALANVIRALSSQDYHSYSPTKQSQTTGTSQHIPYRESKLTRFLQDSLGGHSYTLMIACISSSHDDINESANTVAYAARTKTIRNNPARMKDAFFVPIEEIDVEDDPIVDDHNDDMDQQELELFGNDAAKDDEVWWKRYYTVMRTKTLAVLNLQQKETERNAHLSNLEETNNQLSTKLEEACRYIDQLATYVHKSDSTAALKPNSSETLLHALDMFQQQLENELLDFEGLSRFIYDNDPSQLDALAIFESIYSSIINRDESTREERFMKEQLLEKNAQLDLELESLREQLRHLQVISEPNVGQTVVRNDSKRELRRLLQAQSRQNSNTELHLITAENNEQDTEKQKELERDNLFYKTTNRELKAKLKEFVQVQRKQIDALRAQRDECTILKEKLKSMNKM